MKKLFLVLEAGLLLLFLFLAAAACAAEFRTTELPLERAGVQLHLDCMTAEGTAPEKNILLVHGLTYSSHEFDVDYADYSLVRFLAGRGYAVWRLDIAGYGRSGAVADGFLPDSDYAAQDVHAAVRAICAATGSGKIDVLGWSWGTVTTARCAAAHPENIRRLVLYAPILTGLGQASVSAPFNHNTWEHAADDFQKSGAEPDPAVTDPTVAALYLANCWRYDRESSPNGGRRDVMTPETNRLFFPERLQMPTLVIYGDRDPFINRAAAKGIDRLLPRGSKIVVLPGGGHAMLLERALYKPFREAVLAFLQH